MTRIILGILFGVFGGYIASKVIETVSAASAAQLDAAIKAIGQ